MSSSECGNLSRLRSMTKMMDLRPPLRWDPSPREALGTEYWTCPETYGSGHRPNMPAADPSVAEVGMIVPFRTFPRSDVHPCHQWRGILQWGFGAPSPLSSEQPRARRPGTIDYTGANKNNPDTPQRETQAIEWERKAAEERARQHGTPRPHRDPDLYEGRPPRNTDFVEQAR